MQLLLKSSRWSGPHAVFDGLAGSLTTPEKPANSTLLLLAFSASRSCKSVTSKSRSHSLIPKAHLVPVEFQPNEAGFSGAGLEAALESRLDISGSKALVQELGVRDGTLGKLLHEQHRYYVAFGLILEVVALGHSSLRFRQRALVAKRWKTACRPKFFRVL